MICLFGGTFDPVHLGHLHAATTVCEALALSEVRMLLSALPGHRGVTGASVSHRWAMLELACAGDSRLVADDTEVRRAERVGRPSYTVETLEELRSGRTDLVLAWVVGSDAYREFTSWHRWRDVLDLANLVVLERPGTVLELPDELAALTRERQVRGQFDRPAGQILCLRSAMLDISATRVRAALVAPAAATDVAHLLPAAVYTYIKRHHLYGVVSDA